MKVLLTFEVERVKGVVHACDDHLLIENEHAHWFAFNRVYEFRHHFSVADKVHSTISAGNIDSILDVELACSLNEAGDGFET